MVRGSNPGGSEIFHTRPDRPWDPPSLLYKGYRVIPGVIAAGAWRPHTLSSAEFKERVELNLYSPYGPSWPFLGWILPIITAPYSVGDLRVNTLWMRDSQAVIGINKNPCHSRKSNHCLQLGSTHFTVWASPIYCIQVIRAKVGNYI